MAWRDFLKKLYQEWDHDAIADTAAALTYYGILALFPFLLFLVALTGLVLDPKTIGELVAELAKIAPAQATELVSSRLLSLQQNRSGGLVTLALVGALWAASGGVGALTQALNRCYEVRETRPFWKLRALALAVTVGSGAVTLLASLIAFAVPLVGRFVGGPVGTAIGWLRLPVAGVLVMALWAVLYWVLPNVRPKFHLITPGSVSAVLGWLLASWGFSEYVRHSKSYEAMYGTIGGVIVLLVWMWLSSVMILVGAEINKILTPQQKLARSETGKARKRGSEPSVISPEPA